VAVAAVLKATRTIRVCPFCAGALHRRYRDLGDRLGTVSGTFSVDECATCGAAVVNPSPTGDVSALYPTNYLSGAEEGTGAAAGIDLERRYRYNQYRFDFGLLARTTGEQIGALPSYVDLGCGSGERVAYAAERGCARAVGVDKFDFAKTAAQRRVEIVNAELLDFRPAQRFRLASLFHVLEHLEHPGEAIDHVRECVLEPGGHVIIQVPNYGALDRRWFGARWFGLDVPRHLWHFTPAAIGRLLSTHGYDVIGLHQKNAPLHPVTIVPSLFPSVDVQRVWTDRAHGAGYKRMMQVLWAGLTLLSVPVCVVENLLGQASMLTVIARPR
jgi:SAM-dependent methyltransferase